MRSEETKNSSSSIHQRHLHHHPYRVVVKVALSFLLLLLGLTFRLLIPDTFSLSSPPPSPLPLQHALNTDTDDDHVPTLPSSPYISTNATDPPDTVAEACDIFVGDWVPDPSGPAYTNSTCRVIESHQDCASNGRPDSNYVHWRWKPRDCSLPRFDPRRFLDSMRDKSWAFIGDSISRNHVQSFVCSLSQAEEAVEVYHDEEYRSKIWHFPVHNFSVSVIWTPFLVKADIFEDINGVSSSETQLHLDVLDEKWTGQYHSFNYVVIAGGKWFLKTAIYHENDTVTGCHYCPGRNLTELGFDYAYRKVLRVVLSFVLDAKGGAFVFLRTTTPDHFENGEWFSGGTCNRTIPYKDGEVELRDVDTIMHDIEMEEFKAALEAGSKKGITLRLLDTTRLSLLRPDGHPGPYRESHPFAKDKNAKVQNDCLHWCLPGPIDSWNDLVMEMAGTP
ncbi:hypothetical protein MLD38_018243 [Melastoma candidum]|uniref:Uncharacterized protein n=1 Tax=Melastoma candidum TaxID=119954 RepID=A0ACB9QSC5_9MYRT|nr:hypothetical protein MLD38_018243 [Melastoma candidum]